MLLLKSVANLTCPSLTPQSYPNPPKYFNTNHKILCGGSDVLDLLLYNLSFLAEPPSPIFLSCRHAIDLLLIEQRVWGDGF